MNLGGMKIFYFMSESFLKELSNINYFTSKSILTKSILIKSVLSKINSTKVESNTLLIVRYLDYYIIL